jgi:hypothetical protein
VDVALVGFAVEEPTVVDALVEVETETADVFELDVVFETEVADDAEATPGMH